MMMGLAALHPGGESNVVVGVVGVTRRGSREEFRYEPPSTMMGFQGVILIVEKPGDSGGGGV